MEGAWREIEEVKTSTGRRTEVSGRLEEVKEEEGEGEEEAEEAEEDASASVSSTCELEARVRGSEV